MFQAWEDEHAKVVTAGSPARMARHEAVTLASDLRRFIAEWQAKPLLGSDTPERAAANREEATVERYESQYSGRVRALRDRLLNDYGLHDQQLDALLDRTNTMDDVLSVADRLVALAESVKD
jgi:hypothetical protein